MVKSVKRVFIILVVCCILAADVYYSLGRGRLDDSIEIDNRCPDISAPSLLTFETIEDAALKLTLNEFCFLFSVKKIRDSGFGYYAVIRTEQGKCFVFYDYSLEWYGFAVDRGYYPAHSGMHADTTWMSIIHKPQYWCSLDDRYTYAVLNTGSEYRMFFCKDGIEMVHYWNYSPRPEEYDVRYYISHPEELAGLQRVYLAQRRDRHFFPDLYLRFALFLKCYLKSVEFPFPYLLPIDRKAAGN